MGKQARIGAANRSAPDSTPIGAQAPKPPPSNYGGNSSGHESTTGADRFHIGADRGRVNLSVPPGVDAVLARAAERLGMTRAQLALHLVVSGLPELDRIVRATDV